MFRYAKQSADTIQLLNRFSSALEKAAAGKLSTNEITPERLMWEIYNKVFNILVICENCITFKDSLTSHLVARYTYEMLIVSAYIFQDKTETTERVRKFLEFNQFQSQERKWTKVDYASIVEALPDNSRFSSHKDHYRRLSNFAHPTMDSFLLNRRGNDAEFLQMLNTVLLTIGTILELVKITIEEDLYFENKTELMIETAYITAKADELMKELRTA